MISLTNLLTNLFGEEGRSTNEFWGPSSEIHADYVLNINMKTKMEILLFLFLRGLEIVRNLKIDSARRGCTSEFWRLSSQIHAYLALNIDLKTTMRIPLFLSLEGLEVRVKFNDRFGEEREHERILGTVIRNS